MWKTEKIKSNQNIKVFKRPVNKSNRELAKPLQTPNCDSLQAVIHSEPSPPTQIWACLCAYVCM
jgi:hypothetical protein